MNFQQSIANSQLNKNILGSDDENSEKMFIVRYLEGQKISQSTLNSLKTELFKNQINPPNIQNTDNINAITSQYPLTNPEVQKNLLKNFCSQGKQLQNLVKKKNLFKKQLQQDIINLNPQKQKFSRFYKIDQKYSRVEKYKMFPKEIFLHFFQKFITIYGHKQLQDDQLDQQDDFHNVSVPIYNISYDKTGQLIISADDEGHIKVWSCLNGNYLFTLKGHKSYINTFTISECNTYIASCSNDKTVRVWNLLNNIPIAVFYHSPDINITSLQFFEFKQQLSSKNKLVLIGLSENGKVYRYDEENFINNEGSFNINQEYTLYQSPYLQKSNNQISCMEINADGYICVGTKQGEMIFFDKMDVSSEICNQYSIYWQAHRKNCNSLLWNKSQTMIASGSEDGTAKLWKWNNSSLKQNIEISNLEATLSYDVNNIKMANTKCWAIQFSNKSRYLIATFTKEIIRESDQMRSKIVIYDVMDKKILHNLDHINCPVELNREIYVVDTHPFNEDIMMTADYEGKIIIWDIKYGYVLKIFTEMALHLNNPLLEVPLLDGKFSPDGYNMIISTIYGSFSIYGYGDKEMFNYTYSEQFGQRDSIQFNLDDNYLVQDSEQSVEVHKIEQNLVSTQNGMIYKDQIVSSISDLIKKDFFDIKFVKYDELVDDGEEIAEKFEDLSIEAIFQENLQVSSQKDVFVSKLLKIKKEVLREKMKFQMYVDQSQIQNEEFVKSQESQQPFIGFELLFNQYLSYKLAQNCFYDQKILITDHHIQFPKQLQNGSFNQFLQMIMNQQINIQKRIQKIKKVKLDEKKDDFYQRQQENEDEESDFMIDWKDSDDHSNGDDHNNDSHNQINRRSRIIRTRRQPTTQLQQISVPQQRQLNGRHNRNQENLLEITRSGRIIRHTIPFTQQQSRRTNPKRDQDRQNYNQLQIKLKRNSRTLQKYQRKTRSSMRHANYQDDYDIEIDDQDENLYDEDKPLDYGRTRRSKLKILDYDSDNYDIIEKKVKHNLDINLRSKIKLDETNENVSCNRCLKTNIKINCQMNCKRSFHQECAKARGIFKDENFYCYDCLIEYPISKKILSFEARFSDRSWLDINKTLIPQINEKVYFLLQGYEQFIQIYFGSLNLSQQKGYMFPDELFHKLKNDTLCTVLDVNYEFPEVRQKQFLKNNPIFMRLALKIDKNDNDIFLVPYCLRNNEQSYLVSQKDYENGLNLQKTINEFDIIQLKNSSEKYQITEICPFDNHLQDSKWQTIKVDKYF